MHDLKNLKDMLCKELSDYGRDGSLSLSSLNTIDTLAHAAKNVAKLIEYGDEEGASFRRGRDKMGRYMSRDGSEMARRLREMMDETTDDSLRGEIRRLADKMESM